MISPAPVLFGYDLATDVAISLCEASNKGMAEFCAHAPNRLVLMHGGGFLPYQAGRLVHARAVRPELADSPAIAWGYFGQLYFDTITHDARALRYLVERVGLDNVVLGTDLPFDMALDLPLATLADALTEAETRAVAAANPRRLFGLG